MYWAGLHNGGEKLDLEAGAEALKATALHFHPHRDPGATREPRTMGRCYCIELVEA
jgi:hypothetical protein